MYLEEQRFMTTHLVVDPVRNIATCGFDPDTDLSEDVEDVTCDGCKATSEFREKVGDGQT